MTSQFVLKKVPTTIKSHNAHFFLAINFLKSGTILLSNGAAAIPSWTFQVLAAVSQSWKRSIADHVAVGKLFRLQSAGTGNDGLEEGTREAPASTQVQKTEAGRAQGRVQQGQQAVVSNGGASG